MTVVNFPKVFQVEGEIFYNMSAREYTELKLEEFRRHMKAIEESLLAYDRDIQELIEESQALSKEIKEFFKQYQCD